MNSHAIITIKLIIPLYHLISSQYSNFPVCLIIFTRYWNAKILVVQTNGYTYETHTFITIKNVSFAPESASCPFLVNLPTHPPRTHCSDFFPLRLFLSVQKLHVCQQKVRSYSVNTLPDFFYSACLWDSLALLSILIILFYCVVFYCSIIPQFTQSLLWTLGIFQFLFFCE